MHIRTLALALSASIACAGCGGDEDTRQEEPPPESPSSEPASTAPDTTEAAFWAHLQEVSYRSWDLWPGTTPQYAGTEPHGMLLTTYVNELARDALTNGAATMPAGAIIVKENYMADGSLAAITAMHKVAGYDPAHNDWYWAKWDPNGVVDVAGRAQMCASCHAANARADYLMTARVAAR